MNSPLLVLDNLGASVRGPDGADVDLLRGVSLTVARGERVALVGESGSGKSVTGRAILKLDDNIALSGAILLDGKNLLELSDREMSAVRGVVVSMVFQDPLSALDPLRTIGEHVMEPLRIRGVGRREAESRAIGMLDELQVPDARRRMRSYPHEFSGGMRQRVVLAMALINNPELLIADEPTTALDVRVQAQVLELLDSTIRERGLATLFITHNLGVVSSFADRVLVMYSGAIVEGAPTRVLLEQPRHPYTIGLIGASPRMTGHSARLVALPGTAPRPSARVVGCAFSPRCPMARETCFTRPQTSVRVAADHDLACEVVQQDLLEGAANADR